MWCDGRRLLPIYPNRATLPRRFPGIVYRQLTLCIRGMTILNDVNRSVYLTIQNSEPGDEVEGRQAEI